MSLLEEKVRDDILDGSVFVDVAGKRVGVINGLAVYEVGEYMFGKPSRISAVVYAGKSGVINIERESRLSGRIHSKGVMIISGYIGAMFGQEVSPSVTVSVCFEQSYGPIDGDSASAAELFCVLSALSDVPISQEFAVTGSVNQYGEIQPVGGINEKIEAWYDLCVLTGLTGSQGVVIPRANVRHLMLKQEVVQAVAEGTFRVIPIARVEEGLEILTGTVAGCRDEHLDFVPEESILARAAVKLARFDSGDEEGDEGTDGGESEEEAADRGGEGDARGDDASEGEGAEDCGEGDCDDCDGDCDD
jgi:predicted ATP-dependent protease